MQIKTSEDAAALGRRGFVNILFLITTSRLQRRGFNFDTDLQLLNLLRHIKLL